MKDRNNGFSVYNQILSDDIQSLGNPVRQLFFINFCLSDSISLCRILREADIMAKVLVVGANGQTGRQLVTKLKEKGHDPW